ncbi:heavy-metal-associated domain-containing protein [Oleidesulfovibrio sp.]|uniref:heavy-metal-associated domain-containing protein n=1 Tax=Oleidesulfovibrio sp. TaxID=2909707 RepID=UPI003A8607CF
MPKVKVKGMSCNHCKTSVTNALSSIEGLKNVNVDLEKGEASWEDANATSPVDTQVIKNAIVKIGFDAE